MQELLCQIKHLNALNVVYLKKGKLSAELPILLEVGVMHVKNALKKQRVTIDQNVSSVVSLVN